jgi:hypothetical protein
MEDRTAAGFGHRHGSFASWDNYGGEANYAYMEDEQLEAM